MSCCRLLLPVAVAFCFANKSKNIATGELAIKLQFFIRDVIKRGHYTPVACYIDIFRQIY